MRSLIPLIIICLWVLPARGQETPVKGQLKDSIPISGTANESYGIYLPTSFDETRLSPVLFVFEPAARAAIGIRPFIPAAEKHGIVVVCSNNSRNGLLQKNFQLAENLFAAIFEKYSIDSSQMYLAGFSGGSRLASAIATLTDQFAGVIACGAGFSGNPSEVPSTQGYAYAGLCGDEDMNYAEMLNNKGYLDQIAFRHTLFTFEGGHRWPPAHEIERAINWLFLQRAISNSSTQKIADDYQAAYTEVEESIANGKLLIAEENLERILKAHGLVLPLDSVKAKHSALLRSKAHKAQKKAFEKALSLESRLNERLLGRFFRDIEKPDKANLDWWQKELEQLRGYTIKDGILIKKAVARVRYNIYAAAAERGNPNLFQSNGKQLAFCDTIRKSVYR